MEKFLTLTVSGAVSGAIFSLIAAGLVLSYSATGIFNFSYGAIAFTSAFLYYQLNSGLHWPIVPAAVFVILVFAPLFGLAARRGACSGLSPGRPNRPRSWRRSACSSRSRPSPRGSTTSS